MRARTIDYLRRFVYRNLSDLESAKALVGKSVVEQVKQLMNTEEIVTARPFREVFPQADPTTVLEETEIPYDHIGDLNLRQENRLREEEGVYDRPRIFTATVNDALICPTNNVVMNDERAVAQESINMRGRTKYGLDRGPLCRNRVDTIEGHAMLLRGPATGYWHAQLDSIPRTSLLRTERYRSLPRIKLIRPEGKPGVNVELEDYLVPKITPPNCEIVEVPRDRLYRVENYVFASFLTFPFSAHLPEFYLELLDDRVLPDRERSHSERIFISRKKASRRKILNEDELFGTLERYGFDRYHLEEMTIEEKIDLFYDAEIVVSPTSSGIASLLYTRDIPVVELFPMPQVTHPANYFLSASVGNDHHYVPHDGDSLTADFRADVERVEEKLASITARE